MEKGKENYTNGGGGRIGPRFTEGRMNIEGRRKNRNEKKQIKQEKKRRNSICLKGKMGGHLSSGEKRFCKYKKSKHRNSGKKNRAD